MVFRLKPSDGPRGCEEHNASPAVKTEELSPSFPKSRRARRDKITRNACRQCRAKKTKCGGQHPTCLRCQTSNTTCTYDTSEGVTKMQSLKDQLEARTQEHARAAALLRVLVEDSDQAATQLLAKLRMNHADGTRSTASSSDSTSTTTTRTRRGSAPLPQLYIPSTAVRNPQHWGYSASDAHSLSSSSGGSHHRRTSSGFQSETPVTSAPYQQDMLMYPTMSTQCEQFPQASLAPTPNYLYQMDDTGALPPAPPGMFSQEQMHGWLTL